MDSQSKTYGRMVVHILSEGLLLLTLIRPAAFCLGYGV